MAWPINVIQLCEENTENVRNKRERRTEAKSSHKFGTWNKPLYIRNLGAAQPQSVQNMRDRELFSQFMHICGCPERDRQIETDGDMFGLHAKSCLASVSD